MEKSDFYILIGIYIYLIIISIYKHLFTLRLIVTRKHILSPIPVKTRIYYILIILKRLIIIIKIRINKLTNNKLLKKCKRNI